MPVATDQRLAYAALLPDIGRRLEAAGMRFHEAQFLEDYVDRHPLGAGLYWGIQFRDQKGRPWKADLWGRAPDDFERRHTDDRALAEALRGADRELMLRLKTEARAGPGYYGPVVGSMDIYRFALAKAGRELDALEAWKAAHPAS